MALADQASELRGEMNVGGDELKTFVLQTMNKASAHRENLQQKYD